ncbi:MAG: zinc carboxypeptidase [Xanthomonadaceae bacterium]|nr:zinc carboxypeptidase [Xanthomonadaceae bacterium]
MQNILSLSALVLLMGSVSFAADTKRFIEVEAFDKYDRTELADLGMSIEAFYSDSVWGFVNEKELKEIRKAGFRIFGNFNPATARGGHDKVFGFPQGDERFHDYKEIGDALSVLEKDNSDILKIHSIGKTHENRDMYAIHINTSADAMKRKKSNKPGFVIFGNHHAREHLSAEIPLMFAQYLMANRKDSTIKNLLETRDIWIIPMVNPDGVEHDLTGNKYKMWRKNRRDNKDGTFGVDLNRNYGFHWNEGGSSSNTDSDVYMGKDPFSEPETQAIRKFISERENIKVLLSVHTFSELILYPWSYSYDPIKNEKDQKTFDAMAKTMAKWNKYTPQQSSDLYIASGETCDWAYGEYGIFAFTFELSPRDMWDGGFYPGAKVIDGVFEANLRPMLYLLDLADDPYRALEKKRSHDAQSFLKNTFYL